MKFSKRIYPLLAAFLMFTLLATNAEAQVTDRAKDKAEKKTNQRVDQKIDKGIDKGLDAIEGIFKKKKKKKKEEDSDSQNENRRQAESDTQEQNEKTNSAMMKMFGGGDVEVKDSYSFDHSIDIYTELYNKKGKLESSSEMTMLLSDSEPIFGMTTDAEGKSMKMIFDYENYQMITVPQKQEGGQNMAMVISLDPEAIDDLNEDDEGQPDDVRFVKTGRTKTISGHNCEEYKIEDEDQEDYDVFVWIEPDGDFNWMEAFSQMAEQQKKNDMVYPADYPEGMVVQTVSKNRKNKEKQVSTMKNLQKNNRTTISTEGYQFMNLSGRNN